jgi:hypothetical protein
MREQSFPYKWQLLALETTKTHKEVLERLELFDGSEENRPVIVTRLRNTKTSLTYSVWGDGELGELEPPYTAIKRQEQYIIVVQDTEHFFKQWRWNESFEGRFE